MNVNVSIDWMVGYTNRPEVVLGVQSIPVFRYIVEEVGRRTNLYIGFDSTFTFAEYMMSEGCNHGAINTSIVMMDGTKKTLTGCWSSRASVCNGVLADEFHIIECDLIVNGHAPIRAAVRVSWLAEHLPEGVEVVEYFRNKDEISYTIRPVKGSAIYKELLVTKPSMCTA